MHTHFATPQLPAHHPAPPSDCLLFFMSVTVELEEGAKAGMGGGGDGTGSMRHKPVGRVCTCALGLDRLCYCLPRQVS